MVLPMPRLLRLLFWMPGLTPNRGLRQPGRDCRRADWGRGMLDSREEKKELGKNQTESWFIYKKSPNQGGRGGWDRKQYLEEWDFLLTSLPFKSIIIENYQNHPYFQNLKFYAVPIWLWPQKYHILKSVSNYFLFSLKKKGKASIFVIEKKAVGLQPLVAV